MYPASLLSYLNLAAGISSATRDMAQPIMSSCKDSCVTSSPVVMRAAFAQSISDFSLGENSHPFN
jgi:hypothetical protein